MVNIAPITSTINELDSLYNANSAQATYFSKLALIELCGWIEQTMDSIILDYATLKLSNPQNITFVEKNIVNNTYGFHYESHFRPMLMKVVGIIKLELIETALQSTGEFATLCSQLGTLKSNRDRVAHTTITGITHSYDSPSRIKNYLSVIHPILVKFEKELIALA